MAEILMPMNGKVIGINTEIGQTVQKTPNL